MADKAQIKSLVVSLNALAIKVRDQLAESYDQDTYTNLLDELKQTINVIEQASDDLTEELTQVEWGEVYASFSNARSWQVKLLERVNFIKSFSTNSSTVTKKKYGRLPEVKLATFKGNFDEWETFWSSFRTNVDIRDELEKSTKFIYLAQSLEGEPKEIISGLAITDDNYSLAVHILKDRYDNTSRQTNVLLQKFHTLLTPKHNPKDLRNFLTEYRKIKTQLSHVLDFQQSELVIKSILVRKLAFQTFDKICNTVMHDFTLKQMETGIQHIIDKLEQASLALGERANVKQVGVSSQQTNQPTKQSNQKMNQRCSYCSSGHFSHECIKYKTVNARKDRVMSLRLCFNCLKPGHSSKVCRSSRTCRTCGLHHHSSLCIKAHSNSNSNEASNPSTSNSNSAVSQGKLNQSSTSTNNRNAKAQAQSHPNKPVVTPNKTNASQASRSPKVNSQSPAVDTTYVTSVNSSNFPNNVLPTATLNVRYCDKQVNVRAFFDTGSHRSFISPEVVKRLNLRVIKQVPVNLSTFGNETESCMLDLVKVKVRLWKHKIPITLLVHNSAAMGYFNCPSLYEVAQTLENKGFHLADHSITSDALTGIEILIGVDHFTRLIVRQKRSQGTSLFVTKGGGVIPFGPLPKWAVSTSEQSNSHVRCVRIICENKPELEVAQLWDLERICILPESFSSNERETISVVRSNMQQTESGYIVRLPFKDETRPSVNYRTARGQLNQLIQRVETNEQFGQQYDKVVESYVEKEFIEQIPNQPVEGHYMPHHAVFKRSATTPLCILFNASSKPNESKSLNDCLMTGLSLTAKLHEILLQFRQGKYAVTADISKAFHRIIVHDADRKFLKFLWINLNSQELLTFQFKVVLFGATCSPYLLQETLYTHLPQNAEGNSCLDKFYVDNYMNTYSNQAELVLDKVRLDDVMNQASMPLQEWVSNNEYFNSLYQLAVPITQNVLGISWNPYTDNMNIVVGEKLTHEDSWRYTKRKVLSLVSSVFDPLG